MSAGTAAVTAIVVASATARALAWRRLGVSSIDIGDMLLVAMFAVALLGRCDPAVSFGIIGRLRWTAVAGSAALFLAGAAVGSGWRDRLWDKWRRWMERAGVNPGGAAIAVGLAPASWRMAAAAALTASGALLEEMLFRGFLLRWVRELVGFCGRGGAGGGVRAGPRGTHGASRGACATGGLLHADARRNRARAGGAGQMGAGLPVGGALGAELVGGGARRGPRG